MNRDRKFLFVYCSPPGEGMEFVSQPLGILYLGAILEGAGCRVACTDERIFSQEEIHAAIRDADVVGFSVMTPFVKRAYALARYAKAEGKMTMIGGGHATVDPGSLLDSGLFDLIFIGEAELTITEVLPILDDKERLREIPGLAFHDDDGGRVCNDPRPFNKQLDRIPFPARHLLPMDAYFQHNDERLIYVFTSRGCPYTCVFCTEANHGRGIRTRSVENVCDELEALLAEYTPGAVLFIDELFTANRKRVIALCDEMVRRGIELDWVCETRVDRVDPEMLMAMRRAGMRRIYFGVETGSPESLKTLNKRFTLEQILTALKMARRANLWTKVFLIIGTPNETLEDIELTAKMLRDAMPDMARCALFNPVKGSAAYTIYHDRIDHESMTSEYVNSPGTPYRHENFTLDELNALRERLVADYEAWYRRPRRRLTRWLLRMRFYAEHPAWILRRRWRAWSRVRAVLAARPRRARAYAAGAPGGG